MPSLFSLAALCLFVAQASAQKTCNPNFEGAPVRISNMEGAQFVPSATQAAWFVQLNGQSSNPSYILKDRSNTNRAFTSGGDGALSVTTASNSGTAPNQFFTISCNVCNSGASSAKPGTVIASGCTMRPNNLNRCVQFSGNPTTAANAPACDNRRSQQLSFTV
ncbi:hypothetical protein V5O48_014584 [Marasmius crinis-equi]|uniref:Uncharacterized protein n=1 Tax=Marasmius crinis-equi TaxID=585013 RepID=A0ABR3EX87_9AGAR